MKKTIPRVSDSRKRNIIHKINLFKVKNHRFLGHLWFFEQKLARNTLFLSKDIIVLDSDQVSCLVPTVLHLSAAKSEHFDFNILKKLQMFVRVIENLKAQWQGFLLEAFRAMATFRTML